MDYDVQLQRVEPHIMAAVRRQAKAPQLPSVIPAACGEVWQFLRAAGIANSGLNAVVYHDQVMNIDCGVIVNAPFNGNGSVKCTATPGGNVVTVAHYGPYNLLGEAYRAITDWCNARHVKTVGPSWEIYGHWNDDPSQLRTDIYFLLADNCSG
jgi:effector-binding domain-containing protein